MKTCKKCKIEKELTSFVKTKIYKSGYDNTCKDCRRAPQADATRRYKLKKPLAVRLNKIRRRVMTNNAKGTVTTQQAQWRIDMWGGMCYLCGVDYTALDHVIPLSKGGTNYPANLRPICTSCNSSKSNKDWRQFVP